MTCLFPLDFVALSGFDYLQQLSSQILSGSPSSSTQNSKQFGSRQGSLATTLKNRSTSFSIKQKFLVLSATQNNIGTTCKLNISVVYISLKPDKFQTLRLNLQNLLNPSTFSSSHLNFLFSQFMIYTIDFAHLAHLLTLLNRT